MKCSGKVGNGQMNKWLHFNADPDHDTVPDPDRDTGNTCLGGGMHCPSASTGSFPLIWLQGRRPMSTMLTVGQLIRSHHVLKATVSCIYIHRRRHIVYRGRCIFKLSAYDQIYQAVQRNFCNDLFQLSVTRALFSCNAFQLHLVTVSFP